MNTLVCKPSRIICPLIAHLEYGDVDNLFIAKDRAASFGLCNYFLFNILLSPAVLLLANLIRVVG